jgi:hypothetical protein
VDDDTYWDLVERARTESGDDSPETVAETLVAVLATLGPSEVVGAEEAFARISRRAYGFPLWGAAYVLNGGLRGFEHRRGVSPDDGFDDFRGWLVTRGRAVYEAALADPESLADVVTVDELYDVTCEDVLSAADQAHTELTGRGLPWRAAREPLPDLGAGWDFDDEDEMRRRYPRLSALADQG